MNLLKIKLFFLLTLSLASVFAQQDAKSLPKDPKTIKLFFEKTYLQTDRIYYSSGEDIWFSAYLVNGKSASLTSTSNNLYVELINPKSAIIESKVIRLDQGLGKGDFKLKDTLQSGWYQIRAYTNWMRNFGDDFVFQKKIYITNTAIVAPAALQKPPIVSAETDVVVAIPKKTINFFPEGGNLVEGLTSIVAFKTNDQFGNGLATRASVISSKGDTITTFQSTELGLGIFVFMPMTNEKYRVDGYYDQEKFSADLPIALKKGLSLHVTLDSINVGVAISTNEPTYNEYKDKPLSIVIKHAGDKVYTGTLNLTKPNISVNIATKDLPTGLAVLTVIDHLGRPNSERLIYIQPANKVKFVVSPDKNVYQERERVSLHIKATDNFGVPLKTSFSLAVVDGLIASEADNIVSYLMLQSELKGDIKNADQYFDPQNPRRLKQLDLLLLTQGWRNYIWQKLADSTMSIKYLPEPGLGIKGSVSGKIANKPMPGMNITLFGSSFVGNKIYVAKTDTAGNYFLDGLNWTGNQAIKLSSQDAKAKKGGWLQIDTSFNRPPIKIQRFNPFKLEDNLATEIGKRVSYNRTYKIGDSILLDEVKIISGVTDKVQLFDQTVSTFGYKDQVFNITAADYSFKGLEHFLLTKAVGAMNIDDDDTTGNEGVAFLSNGKKIRPRVLVNNKEDIQDRLDYYSLTMDQINQVVIKHLIDNMGKDVYVVSLNLKESAFRGPNLNLLNLNLNGYYSARAFYSPNYAISTSPNKDLRTTVFWAPTLTTNDKGEAQVIFYNGDNKGSVVIKAEGITATGSAVAAKSTYKVQ